LLEASLFSVARSQQTRARNAVVLFRRRGSANGLALPLLGRRSSSVPTIQPPFNGARHIHSVGKSQREHHRPPFISFSNSDLPLILATVFPKAKLRRFDFFEQTRCRILFEGRAYRLLNEMAQESSMSSAPPQQDGTDFIAMNVSFRHDLAMAGYAPAQFVAQFV